MGILEILIHRGFSDSFYHMLCDSHNILLVLNVVHWLRYCMSFPEIKFLLLVRKFLIHGCLFLLLSCMFSVSFCLDGEFLSAQIMDLSGLIKLIFFPFLSLIGGKDGVPLWEKKFCTSVGRIPWGKIVDNKKYIHFQDNVLSWDDSAGKVAFQNAKKRFWAEINGLLCDIPLPDPDMYIDEIDWNISIDPELIKELDEELHNMQQENNNNPREFSNVVDLGALKKEVGEWNPWESWGNGGDKAWDDFGSKGRRWNQQEPKNWNNGHNTWESQIEQNNGALKHRGWGYCEENGWGRNEWDNGDNPWPVKNKGWGDFENKDWGWNQREPKNLTNDDNTLESRFRQNKGAFKDRGWRDCRGNGWGRNQGDNGDNPLPVKNKGWGEFENKDWGWNQKEPKYLNNGDNPWESRFGQNNGTFEGRGWRDCGGNGFSRKQWGKNNNELKHREFTRTDRGTWNEGSQTRGGVEARGTWNEGSRKRRSVGGKGTWNEGGRKRGGSYLYTMDTKSSRPRQWLSNRSFLEER